MTRPAEKMPRARRLGRAALAWNALAVGLLAWTWQALPWPVALCASCVAVAAWRGGLHAAAWAEDPAR